MCVIMGTGELGFNEDGPALETRLASPTSVGVDDQGRPMVVDYSNMRIRVLAGERIQTLCGNGTHAYSEIGAEALQTPLENPVDALFFDGRLYLLPQHEGRVVRVGDDGRMERFAGTGELDYTGDGGDALDATMGYGTGLAFAEDGTLFVSDNTHGVVRRVTPDGTIDTVIDDLSSPERIAVDDARSRLVVADGLHHRVVQMDLDSLKTTVLAEGGLNTPTGVVVADDGTVIVSDFGNNRLVAVDLDGNLRPIGDGEYALTGPAGLAWIGGDLLIAERAKHQVVRWKGAKNAL